MNSETKSLSPSRAVLTITASAEEAAEIRAETVRKYAARASIPGFRPGKAPAVLVERKFSDRISEDADALLRSRGYRKAVEDGKLRVVEVVSVSDTSSGADGSKSFEATVDLLPEFELPPLEGIPIDDEKTPVTDAQVQERFDSIMRSLSTYEKAPDGEAAKEDDQLVVSYAGVLEDGRPISEAFPGTEVFSEREDSKVVVGGDYFLIPGLPKALVGAKPGDSLEVPVEFPADFFKDELKGVKAVYKVQVKSASRLEPPKLDEALFKRLSVADEADLRRRIREGMEQAAADADESRHADQVARFLGNSVKVELPQNSLERASEEILSNMLRYNMDKGVDKEALSKERERLQEAARENAAMRLRIDFALDEAARKLGVELTEGELNAWLNAVVRAQGLNSAQIKELGKDRERLSRHRDEALRRKTLRTILKNAKPSAGVK